MPRQLLVLRHAKSSWANNALSDFERPLAKRGRSDAPRMGKWMHRRRLIPDFVVSSPALRAKETAVLVCKAMDFERERVVWDSRIYTSGLDALLEILARVPDEARRVMVVGHNPELENLVRHLVGDEVEEPPDGKLLPTAALACLDMPKSWTHLPEHSGRLRFVIRPKALPE